MLALAFTCCDASLSATPSGSTARGMLETWMFLHVHVLEEKLFLTARVNKVGQTLWPVSPGISATTTVPTEFWHCPACSLLGEAWARNHSQLQLSHAHGPIQPHSCGQTLTVTQHGLKSLISLPPASHSICKSVRLEGWRQVTISLQQEVQVESLSILVPSASHTAWETPRAPLGQPSRQAGISCATEASFKLVIICWIPTFAAQKQVRRKKKSSAWSCKKTTNSPWNVWF